MWEPPPGHPLRRMFAGVTEHAFITTLGVADPPLIDYLALLLARFLHADDLYRFKGRDGKPLAELTAMAVAADRLPAAGPPRREAHRHVGDFALFWSGFFADNVHRKPALDRRAEFALLGKRSYGIAAAFDRGPFAAEAPLLRRLCDEFELCAAGLHEVRREFDELGQRPPDAGGGLIRP